MSVGLSGLVVVRSFDLVLSAVAILALGAAFVVPNLAAMVASDSGGRFGEALGLKKLRDESWPIPRPTCRWRDAWLGAVVAIHACGRCAARSRRVSGPLRPSDQRR